MAHKPNTETSTANLGFEQKLWLAADKLRNNMDAAEPERSGDSQPQAARRASEVRQYKHVVLGLIFLSRAERDRSRGSVTRRASRGLRVKYISDTFEEHRAKLLAGEGDYAGANPEDPDEPSGARQTATGSPKGERGGANQYKAENVFWVPADARWSHLQANAKQPTIGKTVDDAMVAIERDNPRLKGVLPKDYARPALDTARRDSALSTRGATPQSLSAAKDNHRLGELIDLIATISLTAASEGEKTHRSVDLLGRVYDWSGATKTAAGSPKGERGGAHQYFLTRFASAEGKNGGQPSGARQTAKGSPQGERGGVHQFYTPSCVVRCLVEMLAPYTALRGSAFHQSEASPQVVSEAKDNGRIYDPACGSGGSLPASRLCGVRFAEKDRALAPGGVQSESRSEAETASRRLPAGRAQRGNFVESHGGPGQRDSASPQGEATLPSLSAVKGNRANISIYGQDKWARRQRPFGLAKRARRVRLRRQQPKQSNATTRRLAIMNLAIRGIEADIGKEHADTFRSVQHPDLRADTATRVSAKPTPRSHSAGLLRSERQLLANPPFNDSDTALRDSAFLQSEAKPQVVSEAKDNMADLVDCTISLNS